MDVSDALSGKVGPEVSAEMETKAAAAAVAAAEADLEAAAKAAAEAAAKAHAAAAAAQARMTTEQVRLQAHVQVEAFAEPASAVEEVVASEVAAAAAAAALAPLTVPPSDAAAEDAALSSEVLFAGKKPAVRRQDRGSLFARLRLGGAPEDGTGGASDRPSADRIPQQLQAMSEQLEAVTSVMKVEQQARVAAEAQLEETREQVQGLLKHLHEMEKARREEASTLGALRGLLNQLQGENAGLKEQNANLVAQCRSFMGGS